MIEFHPEASEEIFKASFFYDSRQNGLGEKFLDALDSALNVIEAEPFMWKADRLGRRKYLVWKFPYQLIYKVEPSRIYILAVAHTSRKPGYWELRDMQL